MTPLDEMKRRCEKRYITGTYHETQAFHEAHEDRKKLIEALEVALEGLEDASGNACSCCDSSDEVWKHCSKVADRIRQILGE